MARRSKKLLFISLVAIFLVITPLIVFYSLGWRFNWKEKSIEQPGAFYFKVLPRSAQIYLNSKEKKNTDFLFGSVLIENLSAKNYNIEIKKQGYKEWKKNLEIENGKVTEAKNIILIPENNDFKNASEKLKNFWVSQNQKQMVMQEESENSWSLSFFDQEKNEKFPITAAKDIFSTKGAPLLLKNSQEKAELKDLRFSFDGKKILLEVKFNSQNFFYVINVDKNPFSIEYLALPSNVDYIDFYPSNSQSLAYLRENCLFKTNGSSQELIEKDILSLFISGNNIYYLTGQGYLYQTNSLFFQKEKLNYSVLDIKKGVEYKIYYFNDYLFIKENNSLYQLDKRSSKLNLVFDNVLNIDFSKDEKKMAIFNEKELWVLYLKDIQEQPEKKEGEKDFLTRFSEGISYVSWLTDHYVVFLGNKTIKISEIDNRGELNIYNIGVFEEPQVYWNKEYKKLFVKDKTNFYYLENLVPWF